MPDATVEDFARRAALLPAALVEATPGAVKAGANVLEVATHASIAAATGGDMRLSGVKSRSEITLRAEVRGAGRSATGVVVPKGPIMLVEENTRQHVQPFAYKINRRVKKRGQKRIKIGDKYYTRVNHPGTTGKRPVRRAFDAVAARAGLVGLEFFSDAARKHLGGR